MTRLVQHRRMQRPYLPVERLCVHCGGRTLAPGAHFDTCRAMVVERMRLEARRRFATLPLRHSNPLTQRVVTGPPVQRAPLTRGRNR